MILCSTARSWECAIDFAQPPTRPAKLPLEKFLADAFRLLFASRLPAVRRRANLLCAAHSRAPWAVDSEPRKAGARPRGGPGGLSRAFRGEYLFGEGRHTQPHDASLRAGDCAFLVVALQFDDRLFRGGAHLADSPPGRCHPIGSAVPRPKTLRR